MYKYTKLIYVLLIFMLFIPLYGAWLENIPGEIVQPDGTVIEVLLSGDEFHNWAHDENGYTIIRDTETGFWCWAIEDSGDLISSGYPVHLYLARDLNIPARANISEDNYLLKRNRLNRDTDNYSSRTEPVSTNSKTSGKINSIVIFIRFADDSEFPAQRTVFDNMLNARGENVNSMYQYYWDASYNQLEVISPMFPNAIGETILSYRSTYSRAFFQPYDPIGNPIGYREHQAGEREHSLLKAAIEHVTPQIPVDLNLDNDGNNAVDNVNFIVRGGFGAWASILWPHMWTLPGGFVSIHGKQVAQYNFNIENFLYSQGASVLVHEFGHSLGMPDLYRYNGNDTPIGYWDLMASNTIPPQSISAHIKNKYTDWIAPIPELITNGTYTLSPITTSRENNAFRISLEDFPTEYFVLEYRNNQTGLIDSTLPGSGIVFYRVRLNKNGNSDPPDELYVFRPGATMSGEIQNAYFSSDVGRTEFSSSTNPVLRYTDGSTTGISFSNIGSAGDTISFQVTGLRNTVISSFPYLEDFRVVPPHAWIRRSGRLLESSDLVPHTDNNWTNNQHWHYGPFARNNQHENGQSMRVSFAGDNRAHWLITPSIYLPENVNFYYLTFDMAFTDFNKPEPTLGGIDDIFCVVVSSDNGLTWLRENTIQRWDNQSGGGRSLNRISNTGETVTLRLKGYSGLIKIGFYVQSTRANSDNLIHIDNVNIWYSPIDILPPITGTSLISNFPNPFNPSTTILFSLENRSRVVLDIFNIRGQKIITLLDEIRDYGDYEVIWHGRDEDDRPLASGVYLYRFKADGVNQIRKMMLLK